MEECLRLKGASRIALSLFGLVSRTHTFFFASHLSRTMSHPGSHSHHPTSHTPTASSTNPTTSQAPVSTQSKYGQLEIYLRGFKQMLEHTTKGEHEFKVQLENGGETTLKDVLQREIDKCGGVLNSLKKGGVCSEDKYKALVDLFGKQASRLDVSSISVLILLSTDLP